MDQPHHGHARFPRPRDGGAHRRAAQQEAVRKEEVARVQVAIQSGPCLEDEKADAKLHLSFLFQNDGEEHRVPRGVPARDSLRPALQG